MDCKKCQELILTDYLDGEIEGGLKNTLEQHMAVCDDCQGYFESAQKTVLQPLVNAKRNVLSKDAIWSRLQNDIHAEHEYKDEPEGQMNILGRLKSLIFMPKPVFALATFLAVIMTFLIWNSSINQSHLVQNDQNKKRLITKKGMGTIQTQKEDEVEYIAFCFEQSEDFKDYGTSMEEYFL